jgi:hypothetical protein
MEINSIYDWFNYIQTPRPQLGGMPICPFAKAAIMSNEITIEQCSLEDIEKRIHNCDIQKYKVCIFYLPTYSQYTVEELEQKTKQLTGKYFKDDKVVLDNDPRSPFIIQGVPTTFDQCYLWIVQSLEDLTQKSNTLKTTDYYKYWTKDQIDEVVTWRTVNKHQ